jgi:hypothetical protein
MEQKISKGTLIPEGINVCLLINDEDFNGSLGKEKKKFFSFPKLTVKASSFIFYFQNDSKLLQVHLRYKPN